MVASIPNDIFQFSTYGALHAGFNQGQPRTADLTSHGTDGIGVYEDGSLMVLQDGQAHAIDKDGKATPAPMQSRLPLALVTIYQSTFHLQIPLFSMNDLDQRLSSNDIGPAKGVNTLMPFRITDRFEFLEFEDGPSLDAIDGVLFGFVVPEWMRAISGPRIHAHFLAAGKEVGGKVTDFRVSDQAAVSFAKCARFHLGFPRGEDWESVRL
ncbi:alpha-acetolactate decarboxylase [Decorospora gaudefroyi]|uniref:Alpha-acetolactate decarboxylase n=1 Tax=Decorospora gaudefroyi TaxID=184978 RepID=A0A6A5JVB9_9PLEO|nr:alpha-acetolactate decarboxylase [Decorospora gaudefroyi]